MNNQEFFDRTVSHLRQQGEQCRETSTSSCKYSLDGKHCAIGIHIPQNLIEIYELEGSAVEAILRYSEIRSIFDGVSIPLLIEMQETHDLHFDKWEVRFKSTAKKYDLTLKERG